MIQFKRAYDTASAEDGYRVLADRLWPRGLSKATLVMDEWCKQITPGTELRRDYHHQVIDYKTFSDLYQQQLAAPDLQPELERLAEKAVSGTLTLLSAVKDPRTSHIPLLTAALQQHVDKLSSAPSA
ncbi:DUF488 family protein [Tatumella sp. JGM130]|uniref:DUF488 domain-containing protein n=1 Tax=Tatumella sp. JGM130 TaxID=2799797 RepID=UPI001BAFCAD1|nr:DUF488 family protein [Tatumella sp. JGM130]MBS0894894.1 DUF488 family protein [Tatumella sp. JGM130]